LARISEGVVKDAGRLRQWILGVPKKDQVPFARVLSHRAAMRALPYISASFSESSWSVADPASLTLLVFRTHMTSQVYMADQSRDVVDSANRAGDLAIQTTGKVGKRMHAPSAARTGITAANAAAVALVARNVRNLVECAANIVNANQNSADVAAMWAAVSGDTQVLTERRSVDALLNSNLWLTVPSKNWQNQQSSLITTLSLRHAENWSSWIEWYVAQLNGESSWGLPKESTMALEKRIVLGDGRGGFWRRGTGLINEEIAGWLGQAKALEEQSGTPLISEPEKGPGPQYHVQQGKLSETASFPAEVESSSLSQKTFLKLLAKQAAEFSAACSALHNQHPSLANIAAEYSQLVSVDITDIDVTGVWAVGGSLASFAQAFREQNTKRTLTEPLEPHLDAALQSIVRQHGAFILGFEEGRDLVQRADAFALGQNRLLEIAGPGQAIIEELSTNRDLVDSRTIQLHAPIRDALDQFGWAAGRSGYAGYLIVRNTVRASIKALVGEDQSLVAYYGAVAIASEIAGVPVREFVTVAIPFLRDYSQQLLAFFAYTPEMRAYVEYALELLDKDAYRQR
jgi:hypothetical protein